MPTCRRKLWPGYCIRARAKVIEAAVKRTRHPAMRGAMQRALAVVRRAGETIVTSPAESFVLRYGEPMGVGSVRALAERLEDAKQSREARRSLPTSPSLRRHMLQGMRRSIDVTRTTPPMPSHYLSNVTSILRRRT